MAIKPLPRKKPKKYPSESLECQRLVGYLSILEADDKLKFTHIANETLSKRQGIANKRMGVRKGVPDYMLAIEGFGICYIEMKRQVGGRLSKEQKDWIAFLNEVPCCEAHVCNGFDEARKVVDDFVNAAQKRGTERFEVSVA